MKENSIEEDIKIINNFITYFNKNIQNGNKADLTVLGEEINAIEHILSDYKRTLKENEKLRKELNEENKRCMMLAIEKQDYFEKYRYHLQQNERLTKEFSNVILVQRVKDKIRHYQELQDNYIKKYDEINEGLQAMINVLQELIEEREEN